MPVPTAEAVPVPAAEPDAGTLMVTICVGWPATEEDDLVFWIGLTLNSDELDEDRPGMTDGDVARLAADDVVPDPDPEAVAVAKPVPDPVARPDPVAKPDPVGSEPEAMPSLTGPAVGCPDAVGTTDNSVQSVCGAYWPY